MCKLLIKSSQGFDINSINPLKDSALHLAAKTNKKKFVIFLLENNANPK